MGGVSLDDDSVVICSFHFDELSKKAHSLLTVARHVTTHSSMSRVSWLKRLMHRFICNERGM